MNDNLCVARCYSFSIVDLEISKYALKISHHLSFIGVVWRRYFYVLEKHKKGKHPLNPIAIFNLVQVSSSLAAILQFGSLYVSATFSTHHGDKHTDPSHSVLQTGLKSWYLPLADHCAANLQIASSYVPRPRDASSFPVRYYQSVGCHHPDSGLRPPNGVGFNWWPWNWMAAWADADWAIHTVVASPLDYAVAGIRGGVGL